MCEEVRLSKDGEYDDVNNGPVLSEIVTRPGAELKPDWTAFYENMSLKVCLDTFYI